MQTKILRGPTTPDEIILLIAHVTCLKRHDPKNGVYMAIQDIRQMQWKHNVNSRSQACLPAPAHL